MSRRRRLPTLLAIFGFAATLGIMFWMITNGTQLTKMLQPTPTALEAQLEAVRIQKTDFPASDAWQASDPYTEESPNALITKSYEYSHSDAFWIKVTQQLRIYPDVETAQAAYFQELTEKFTPEWETPSEMTFSNHADVITVRCVEGYINNIHHYPCKVIGVYGNVLTLFWANVFDDRWFMMDDLAQLLTVMDQRMVDAMEQKSP